MLEKYDVAKPQKLKVGRNKIMIQKKNENYASFQSTSGAWQNVLGS